MEYLIYVWASPRPWPSFLHLPRIWITVKSWAQPQLSFSRFIISYFFFVSVMHIMYHLQIIIYLPYESVFWGFRLSWPSSFCLRTHFHLWFLSNHLGSTWLWRPCWLNSAEDTCESRLQQAVLGMLPWWRQVRPEIGVLFKCSLSLCVTSTIIPLGKVILTAACKEGEATRGDSGRHDYKQGRGIEVVDEVTLPWPDSCFASWVREESSFIWECDFINIGESQIFHFLKKYAYKKIHLFFLVYNSEF
jgi:hypothetical protein